MGEKLTLNDGTVLADASAIMAGVLFLYMSNMTLKKAFELLIDPEKTRRIVYTAVNGEEKAFENYTRLDAVRNEGGGLVTAVLGRE